MRKFAVTCMNFILLVSSVPSVLGFTPSLGTFGQRHSQPLDTMCGRECNSCPESTILSMYANPSISLSSMQQSSKSKSSRIPPHTHSSGLVSSDTLPFFSAAPGLLSPITVMRMDESTSVDGATRSEAIENFLETYRSQGPMACLPMLSDPTVLPKLTEAMRDIE